MADKDEQYWKKRAEEHQKKYGQGLKDEKGLEEDVFFPGEGVISPGQMAKGMTAAAINPALIRKFLKKFPEKARNANPKELLQDIQGWIKEEAENVLDYSKMKKAAPKPSGYKLKYRSREAVPDKDLSTHVLDYSKGEPTIRQSKRNILDDLDMPKLIKE